MVAVKFLWNPFEISRIQLLGIELFKGYEYFFAVRNRSFKLEQHIVTETNYRSDNVGTVQNVGVKLDYLETDNCAGLFVAQCRPKMHNSCWSNQNIFYSHKSLKL